jgi:hypothetical protein
MATTHDRHQHPLLDAVASISAELDKAATLNPNFVPSSDKAAALCELSTIVTRAQGLLLSVLAASGDVADEAGARSAGDWYTPQRPITTTSPPTASLGPSTRTARTWGRPSSTGG